MLLQQKVASAGPDGVIEAGAIYDEPDEKLAAQKIAGGYAQAAEPPAEPEEPPVAAEEKAEKAVAPPEKREKATRRRGARKAKRAE